MWARVFFLSVCLLELTALVSCNFTLEFSCPEGWTLFPNGTYCYYYSRVELDYGAAVDVCDKYGAALLEVRDEREAKVVAQKANETFGQSQKYFWISAGQEYNTAEDFVIANATKCKGFWEVGQPASDDVNMAIASNMAGRWTLKPLGDRLRFVCRAPACPQDSFRCRDGTCLNVKWKCDQAMDCSDGTDEADCRDCVKHINASSDQIVDFTRKDNCQWTIEGQPGEVLKIEFTAIHIQAGVDTLLIYSGGPSIKTSQLVGQIRSNDMPKTVFGVNHFLIVVFRSTDVASGFAAKWEPDDELSKTVQTIRVTSTPWEFNSPHHNSSNLPLSYRKTWSLEAKEGETILLEIHNSSFDLANKSSISITNVGFSLCDPSTGRAFFISSSPSMVISVQTNTAQYLHAVVNTGCNFSMELTQARFELLNLSKNIVCEWTIKNRQPTNFSLNMQDIQFLGQDSLQLYDGKVGGAPVVTVNGSTGNKVSHLGLSSTVVMVYRSYGLTSGSKLLGAVSADCSDLNSPNLEVSPQGREGGESYKVSITCATGYTFVQEEYNSNSTLEAECKLGGNWYWGSNSLTRLPTCQVVYCGVPSPIDNGKLTYISANVSLGAKATYECYGGFNLSGSDTVECLSNGSWSTPPTCEAKLCPELTDVENIGNTEEIRNANRSFGTVIKFECSPGFDLLGSQQIVCLANGSWNHVVPSCRKLTCPLLPVENGAYNTSLPVEFLAGASLQCHPGYWVERTNTPEVIHSCTANRTLSQNDTCVDIDECLNETHNCNTTTQTCENTIGFYTCNCKDGYQLEQSSYTCTDIDECEENTSYCGQHCHNLVGSYKCSCDPDGFELYTQNGTNGYFLPQAEDGSEPDHKYHINHTCVYTVCDNTPDQPLNGTFLTKRSRFVYNETVAVACEFGFKIEGPSSVRCLGNNSWTQVPTCKEMYCDDIPPKSDLEAGRIPDGKTRLEPGEELVIICRTKHSSETVNKTLFCAPNRTGAFELQGDNPTCPEVDCGEVWNIPGAVVDRPANTTYGSQFEFKCNSEKGFKLRGNSSLGNTTVECQSNGIWGYNSLTCIGHSCGDPGTKAGTRQIVNTSYEVDQVVTYECEQTNYTAERTHLICEFHNGTAKWSGEAPLCVDTQKPTITCPKDKSLSLYETITYDPPKVTDNSVHSCYMLKSGPPSGVAVISNDTTIKFQAYDPHNFSQSVDCEFTIYLKAISRPEIICPVSHDVVLTENLPKTITFNESFIVSSTPNTTLTFTPPSLEVTAGNVYAIRARVQGDNPFYKECAFLLNVTTVSCYKDVIKAPGNGSINCTGNNSTMTCTAACNADFLFQDKTQAQNFTCTNGMWSQASSMDCLELKNTLVGYDISVTYNTTTQMLAGFDNQCFFEHHTILLNNIKLSEICGASRTLATNLKSSRSTLMSITTTLTLKLFTNANATWLEQCIKDTLNSEVFGPTSPMVTGKDCSTPWTVGNSEAPKNLGISCDDKSYEIRFQNESFCLPCGAGMNFSSTCQTCPDGTYQDEDGQTACKPCPDGIKHSSLPRTHVENCIALCPSGFNSSTGYVKDGCTACPTDTYSSPDRLSCTPCPNGGSTVGVSGAVNKSFCFDPCLPGEYSVTGYQPCNECPLHFYTDHNKSLQCEECPEDTYTDKPGSTSLTDCSKKVDQLCTANYCHAAGSNGTCLIKDHRPVCTCNEGYHGDRCNETCDICHTKPCYNNGTCVTKGSDYTCSCPYNEICKFELATNLGIQTGDEVIIQTGVMTQRDCEANCLENKECLAYYFQRPTCLIYLTLVVVVDGIANVYKKNCTQVNLFGGKQCEHDIDIQCKADTCTQPEYCQEMVDGFKCICPAGQDYNETCAIPTDFCSPNPCLNGNCTTFDSVRYECTCPPGYTGKNCEKNIDECKVNPKGCLYNGTCDDNIDEYSCSCAPGFKGSHCEVRHDMCQDITCVEGDGDKCTNDYHSLTASCTCREHYSLSSTGKCEPINYCSSSPCSNGGTCQNFTGGFNCSCPPDFIGATCQFQWKNETETDVCSDLVKCTDRMKEFFCDCQNESAPCTSNYSACIEKCQSSNNLQDILICNCFCRNATLQKGPVDICTMEKPCLHGGNCSHDNETYTCACPLGWTGRDCEVAVDYCNQSNPCHNNGSCINLWDQSFCRCLPGTGGDTCENATDLCHKFNDSLCVDGTCQSTNGSAQCDCSEGSAGQSCELEKNWCNLDLGLCTHGTCVLNNTQFYCDCASGQSGVEGGCVADLCSTCLDPSNCHVYVDASGVPTPGCMCPPDQVAVGKECKVVNGDFDLGFTKELAEKKKYVTSQNGFTIPPNSDLTVSFWFLQIKDVPVDGFMLALMKYNNTDAMTVFNSSFVVISQPKDKKWHMFTGVWFENGTCSINIDINRRPDVKKCVSLKGLQQEYFLVQLGKAFHGYLSKVRVWKTALNRSETFFMWDNVTYLPQPQSLLLNWTYYSYDQHVVMTDHSQVNKDSTYNCSSDVLNACDGEKTLELPCNAADNVIKTNYSIHQVSSSQFYDYTSISNKLNMITKVQLFSHGAHDMAVAAQDSFNNIGVCIRRIYVTPNDCKNTSPSFASINACQDNSYEIKAICPKDKASSVLTPNYITCGKLQSYNLDDMYEMPNRIVCGTTESRFVTLTIDFKCTLPEPISCTNLKDVYEEEIKTEMAKLVSNWTDLCLDSKCSNVKYNSGICTQQQLLVSVEIINSREMLSSPSGTMTPKDLLITNKQLFDCNYVFSMDSFIYGMNVSDIFSCHHGYVLREKLCVECAAGSYYDASEKSCKLCPLNTYSLTSKQTACTPCSGSNNITLQEGSNNISDCKVRCEKGQMLENNICVPCPPNFYQDQTGKHYCLPCPVHTASTSYGSQSVSDCKDICPPGTQLNSSINQCDLCPRGTYRDGTLQDQCKSCPTNATTLKEGSESSDSCNIPLCQPGQFANVTTLECENCSIGSYQPEEAALSCHSCPDNHTTVYEGTQNSDQCKFVCQAPGQEINPANSSTCRLCLRGYYRTGGFDERFANCTKCSGDNTTDVEGATNSAYCNIPICSAGQHISNNKCEACTHDTYQPMDEPYSTTNCTRCGDGLGTVNIASTHKDNCTSFCQPGYGKNGSDCQLCDRGTWNNGNTSLRFEKCQQCRTNYTTEVTGATDLANCTLRKCEPGYKIVGDDCIQCPVGEYQPESNNDTCLKCRNGTSTNSTGSTNETDCTIFCGAGQEGTENDTCVNCSDDEFKTTAGYGPCEMCTGDFTSTPTNRTACTQVHCDKGRELNNTTCQNCQIGFYKDFRGNQSCVPCPANHTTISGGSTHKNNCSVVYCAPGFYSSDNKSCLACDVGFYKSTPGNEACTQCPANWTTHEIASNSISQCSLVLCPLGYVRLNNSQCRPCEKGSYQNGSSQTQCTHCGPINGYNTSTNNTASQNESYCFPVCPEGKIVNISTRSCDQCPYGSYKSHSGLDTFCTRCKDGWTTGVLGATSEDACKIEICDKGFYRPNSTAACKKCPFGTYQDQRDFKEVGECKKCQDNETTLMEGATSLASCIPLCKAGQEYNLISNNCTSCPVGQYKGENDLPSVCKYCLQNETTSSHGAVRCISSITTPPPSYKINVTVDVFATVTCDNPEQTRGALTKALIDMIRSARKLYYSDLCPTDSCANVVVVMVKFCDTQTVKRQANRNAQASVTVRELDSRLRNILYNFHRSAISAVLEALRDHSSVENILAVNQIILELARLVGCPTGNIMEITFTCRHCPIGYFSSNNVCVPCSNGSYSTLPVSDKCLQCNAGETTEKPGSSNKSECIGICKVDNKYCGSNGECITQDGKYQCSCNEYYEGPQCAVRKPSEDSSIGVVVGVSVGVGVLLLLALLIVGICLLRKKRQRKSQPSIASTQDFVNNTYPYMGGPVMMMENPASGMMDPTMYGTELVPFYGQESHLYRSEKRYSSHDSEDDMRNFSLYRKDRNY